MSSPSTVKNENPFAISIQNTLNNSDENEEKELEQIEEEGDRELMDILEQDANKVKIDTKSFSGKLGDELKKSI